MSWRETSAPTTIPFWARCNNPFHLLVLTTFLTQVSLVTIGYRAGRSSAFGLAEAELLSASFRPNGLPSRYACCVALTPLSKRNFYEVISCAVKGRTPLRTGRASRPAPSSSSSFKVQRFLIAHRMNGSTGLRLPLWTSNFSPGLALFSLSLRRTTRPRQHLFRLGITLSDRL